MRARLWTLIAILSVGGPTSAIGQQTGHPPLRPHTPPLRGAAQRILRAPSRSEYDSFGYGPKTCPLFAILVFDDAALYQCEHYENEENCNAPEISYWYGYLENLPGDCNNEHLYCFDERTSDDKLARMRIGDFPGMPWPIPRDYEHKLDEQYYCINENAVPTAIQFVKFRAEGKWRYLKVFGYPINVHDGATQTTISDPAQFDRIMYFALECHNAPSNAKQFDLPRPLPNTHFLYQLTYPEGVPVPKPIKVFAILSRTE